MFHEVSLDLGTTGFVFIISINEQFVVETLVDSLKIGLEEFFSSFLMVTIDFGRLNQSEINNFDVGIDLLHQNHGIDHLIIIDV